MGVLAKINNSLLPTAASLMPNQMHLHAWTLCLHYATFCPSDHHEISEAEPDQSVHNIRLSRIPVNGWLLKNSISGMLDHELCWYHNK